MPRPYDAGYSRRPPYDQGGRESSGPFRGEEGERRPRAFYGDEFAGATWEKRRDELLRAEVRMRLFEDTWLDARHIRVEVSEAVVLLQGNVRTYMEGRYAWDDAWETPGVRGVISQLEVEETAGGRG